MVGTWIARFIHKLEQLLLGGYQINPDEETPDGGDVLRYEASSSSWVFSTVGWAWRHPIGGSSSGTYPLSFNPDVSDPEDVVVFSGDPSAPAWQLKPDGDIEVTGDAIIGGDAVVEGDIESDAFFSRPTDKSTIKNAVLVADAIYYCEYGPPDSVKLGKPLLLNNSDCTYHYHSADRARAVHTGTQAQSTIDTVPMFCGNLDSNISTNGTTMVDITLNANLKSNITHTDGSAEIEIDIDGVYEISAALVSNFNASETSSIIAIYKDTGVGYAKIADSEKRHRTATYNFCQQNIPSYLEELDDGDKIKICASFGGADAGSVWSAAYSTVTVKRIGPKTS